MRNRKEDILYHALFMAQHLSKCDLKDGLVYILLELEMEPHRIGYHYVESAILLFYKSPLPTLLNGIYEKVAENTAVRYLQSDRKGYARCDRPVLPGLRSRDLELLFPNQHKREKEETHELQVCFPDRRIHGIVAGVL